MEAMPDVVPSLAIVAAFAEGTTRITNIASPARQGVRPHRRRHHRTAQDGHRRRGVPRRDDITGGTPHGAVIDTYDDHRIAMCFAIAGLRTEGVVIKDPGCVAKSFPTFWQTLDTLHPTRRAPSDAPSAPADVLLVLDGWGHAPPGADNAVDAARTPVLDALRATPRPPWPTRPATAVGLLPGTVGNSEIGHMVIGAGRPLPYDSLLVQRADRLR